MGEENIEERGVWKCSRKEEGKKITERGFQRTLSCGRIGRGKPDSDLNRFASLWTSPLKMKKKKGFYISILTELENIILAPSKFNNAHIFLDFLLISL